MSISYKKITAMIVDVIENDSRFKKLDKKALKNLCIDVYTTESSLDGGHSNQAVKEAIKGKIATRFAKILKEAE